MIFASPPSELSDALLSLQEELREAKAIFDRILERPRPVLDNALISSKAKGTLNGDLVIADESRGGIQWFLFGDFTGHGLAAAIGTLFASQVFTAMVAKGMTHRTIVRELNRKLRQLLPTGRFMAAAVVSLDPGSGRLEVWNGALPPGFVWRQGEGVLHAIVSRHPPLGVMASDSLQFATDVLELEPGDRVVLMTDGISESLGANGLPEDGRWIEDTLRITRETTSLIDVVQSQLLQQGLIRIDDASLLEIVCPERTPDTRSVHREQLPGISFRFDRHLLPDGQACLSMVLDALAKLVPATKRDLGALSTVTAELFSNAVDHGLLSLDSELKRTQEGLQTYLDARVERLAELRSGSVNVSAEWLWPDRVRLTVAHDGNVFDPSTAASKLTDNNRVYGRGLALVEALCESLEHVDEGRSVVAVLRLDPRLDG